MSRTSLTPSWIAWTVWPRPGTGGRSTSGSSCQPNLRKENQMANKLVTFNADFYPYVYGDVVEVDTDELKRIDEVAKARGIDNPYSAGEHEVSRDTIST